ncbi:MAG TPA: DUF4139 domain-containing protein [Bacteroidales bacterium]|nr:DUF4139 domain-containing protein [Bacteroidales bacterium]
MKRSVFLMLLACLFSSVMATSQPLPVKSKIKDVTVFFNGAQIARHGDIALPAGQSTIIFEYLTQYINAQSIQVKGEGNFDILSVVHQINYLKTQEKTPEVKRIEDSIQLLTKTLTTQQTILAVYEQEETMLLANKAIGGEQTGVKISELKEATEYFRTRLLDIKSNQMNIQDKINKIQKNITTLNNQLQALNARVTEPSSEILVTVSAAAPVTAKLILSYYVTNAGWTPSYDLRAVNVSSPVNLDFRANVYQTTGSDWNNVNLTLSTGNPLQNGSKPVLNPWYLSFAYPYGYGIVSGIKTEQRAAAPMAKEKSDDQANFAQEARTTADYTIVNETQTNIEYNINIPYTIPADGKNHMVQIQKYSLPATYEYYCAPKLNQDVFLLARVSGWDKYNIISGEMNLFFEGTYVGKSYINTKTTADTIEFSLGIDNNISVKREKLQDFSSTKLIGLNKKETYTYQISIRNKKKQNIDIVIDDQVPLSSDKDIEVELLDISAGVYDKDYGKITWKYNLKPSETKEIKLSYSVKYPKDKYINL